MSKLFPEILGIEAGQNSALANRIVDRVKAGNPKVAVKPYEVGASTILNLPTGAPRKSKEKTLWLRAKKALIIRAKQERPEAGGLSFFLLLL
ncbi:MAG: hypothetical protein HOL36_03725 [Candidatus Marinimicrobia bacterium]|jgi:hypothetical protein|nr:hypothetical protein [Candidatus Neomarinimicrobiota bacterium]MBT4682680.1 hypothetical protein [Chloroflexota bacterium]MBT5313383.1 hypothetical protein [Candidatus Neomarinimicrobiota bacterium]